MPRITIGNGKIKLEGDFTGLLILKKNDDGFEYDNVKNCIVQGLGYHSLPKLKDRIKTVIAVWKWSKDKL